jgi:hypothetical protein
MTDMNEIEGVEKTGKEASDVCIRSRNSCSRSRSSRVLLVFGFEFPSLKLGASSIC